MICLMAGWWCFAYFMNMSFSHVSFFILFFSVVLLHFPAYGLVQGAVIKYYHHHLNEYDTMYMIQSVLSVN